MRRFLSLTLAAGLLLLAAGADPALADRSGKTAYALALENRHDDTARAVRPKKSKE